MNSLFDTPKPPNPYQVAGAQSAADLSTAIGQSLVNQTNQVTPTGSLNYSQSGTVSYTDPTTGKTIKIPRFTATQTLTPDQQGLLDQQEEFDKLSNTIGINQTKALGEHLSTPFDYNAGEYENWANNLYGTLNDTNNQHQLDAMDTKLKGQGLQPGTQAYDDAMSNAITGQNRDRTAFLLDAYNTGLNTALTMRNQPINEITALAGGNQVSMPSFVSTPQANLSTPDLQGAIYSNFNQQVANRNAMIGGLSGLGGAALGGWASGGFK